MDIKTPFGVIWRIAPYSEFFIYVGLFILLLIFFFIIKYLQNLKEKKINDYQLFLFKMKRLGLSIFQIKIINNIVEILRLQNPVELLDKPGFFEKGIGKFFVFLRGKNETEDSLLSICKDVTITYEKLYHPSAFKKPLNSLMEIEINQLLYFTTENNDVYLGKIIGRSVNELTLLLFMSAKQSDKFSIEMHVNVYIWRIGDAEYMFKTKTKNLAGNILSLEMVDQFERGHEFRHPYLDVIIPSTLTKVARTPVEEEEVFNGTIFKINDYEAVARLSVKLDYQREYFLRFELYEYKFDMPVIIIANKTIQEKNIYYYTMKLGKVPEGAMTVLKKYIYEHL